MIKNFECYRKIQEIAGNQTQWRKDYEDGEFALLVIDDKAITREKVRQAFKKQEYEQDDE